jgi:hypothetical protein
VQQLPLLRLRLGWYVLKSGVIKFHSMQRQESASAVHFLSVMEGAAGVAAAVVVDANGLQRDLGISSTGAGWQAKSSSGVPLCCSHNMLVWEAVQSGLLPMGIPILCFPRSGPAVCAGPH